MPDLVHPATPWIQLRREARQGQPGSSPTLVLLHGYGKFRSHLFDCLCDVDQRLTVVALQAPFRIGPGAYRWFHYSRDPDGTITIDSAEEAASYGSLVAFLETLRADGAAPLFVLGHSQGGMMALGIALGRPDLIEGCVALNARLLPETQARNRVEAADPVAFFIGHGVNDQTVPVTRGRFVRDMLASLGAHATYKEYAIGHDLTEEVFADAREWLTERLNRVLGPERLCARPSHLPTE